MSELFKDTGTSTVIQKATGGKQHWEVLEERPIYGKYSFQASAKEFIY
jgi:hypothetical protein